MNRYVGDRKEGRALLELWTRKRPGRKSLGGYRTKANEQGWSMPEETEQEAAERQERRRTRAAAEGQEHERGQREQAHEEELRRYVAGVERQEMQNQPKPQPSSERPAREKPRQAAAPEPKEPQVRSPQVKPGRLTEGREERRREFRHPYAPEVDRQVERMLDREFAREVNALATKHPAAAEQLQKLANEGLRAGREQVSVANYVARAVQSLLGAGRGEDVRGRKLDPDGVFQYVLSSLFTRRKSDNTNVFDRFDPDKGDLEALIKTEISFALAHARRGEVAFARAGGQERTAPRGQEGEEVYEAEAGGEREREAREARARRGTRPWWFDPGQDLTRFYQMLEKAARANKVDVETLKDVFHQRASGATREETSQMTAQGRNELRRTRDIVARNWLELYGDDMTKNGGLRGKKEDEAGFETLVAKAEEFKGKPLALRDVAPALLTLTRKTGRPVADVLANAVKLGLLAEIEVGGTRGGKRYGPGANYDDYKRRAGHA